MAKEKKRPTLVAVILPQDTHLILQSFLTVIYNNDVFKNLEMGTFEQWIPTDYGLLKGYAGLHATLSEHTAVINTYNTIPVAELNQDLFNHPLIILSLSKQSWKSQEYFPLNLQRT